MEFSMSYGIGIYSVWEVLWCDDTTARTNTAMSIIIIRCTIVINKSMKVLVIIIMISVINVIVLVMTRNLQMLALSL